MPKTRITAEFTVPTTSMSRIQDVLGDLVRAVEDHKGTTPLVTIHGPLPDDFNGGQNGEGSRNPDLGRRNDERRNRNEAEQDSRDGDGNDSEPEQPKRGRGRPRKSDGDAPASRSSGGDGKRGRSSGSDAEDARGNEPERTRKGSDEGSGQGEGRSRGAGRGRDDQRGNREASRVKDDSPDDWGDEENTEGDDWGDEGDNDAEYEANQAKTPGDTNWPDSLTPKEVDKTTITTLLGDHFQATGGKDRGITFDLMEKVTKVRQLNKVEEEDYIDLAKALLKDIARYKHGIKKAK